MSISKCAQRALKLPPQSLHFFENFLSPAQHDALVSCTFLQERLSRRRYGQKHWDSVIRGYREVELHQSPEEWPPELSNVIGAMKKKVSEVIGNGSSAPIEFLPPHIVDLDATGAICMYSTFMAFDE